MNFYPEEYIVEVVVPFTNLNGEQITPVALRAKLFNGEDVLIDDFGAISLVGASGQKTISVPAIYNTLAGSEIREARVLKVEIDTASGTIHKRHSYVIEAEQTLEIMVNTFQTYETAEIAAINYVNLPGWTVSDEVRRRASLVEAYSRITAVPMKYGPRDDLGQNIEGEEVIITREGWLDMTKDAFSALPTHFRRALRAAQLVEASELLSGDSVGRRHRAGIVTETIGESSMTLRAGKIDYGLSQATMNALVGYINFRVGIARA